MFNRSAQILVFLALTSGFLAAQSDPPPGVPKKLTVCDRYQAIISCADWIWNGKDFDYDYGKSAGKGTIIRSGGSGIVMKRVDTRDPFYAKNTQADYMGTVDDDHSGHGTVTWFIKGRTALEGTWTVKFLPVAEPKPKDDAVELPPPDPTAPSLPMPAGLEVCEGDCMDKGDKNVGTWIFRGAKGQGNWSRGGQVAKMTIVRFDSNGVVIRREDLPQSSSPGVTSVYEGRIHDGRIDGTETLTWPGHFQKSNPPGVVRVKWFGIIPSTTCDSSAKLDANEALETGGKAAVFRQMPSAFQCFQIAADQGSREGKSLIGLMYRDGIGTSINYQESLMWLKAAAIQDDYNAELALEQVYEIGIGVNRDPKEAQLWRARATKNPGKLYAEKVDENNRRTQELVFTGLTAIISAAVRPSCCW